VIGFQAIFLYVDEMLRNCTMYL